MFYAERFSDPTRALSPRQLPTNHVPAVPTRVYQNDQSSRQFLGCLRPCYSLQKTPASLFSEERRRDFKPSNPKA
jgi:hypothetical protein